MYHLKSFKQYIYKRNKRLDGMNDIYDNNNVFSITFRIEIWRLLISDYDHNMYVFGYEYLCIQKGHQITTFYL